MTPNENIEIQSLPRARFGGIRADVVDELLRRLQWDHAQLIIEHRELTERMAAQTSTMPELTHPGNGHGPIDGNGTLAASVEAASSEAGRDDVHDIDDYGRMVLAAARRAASELRESARRDAELTLKKAHARAQLLENQAQRDLEQQALATRAEIQSLESTLHGLREQVRAVLETLTEPGLGLGVDLELHKYPLPGTVFDAEQAPEVDGAADPTYAAADEDPSRPTQDESGFSFSPTWANE